VVGQKPIRLQQFHLSSPQLATFTGVDRRICVEAIWNAINGKNIRPTGLLVIPFLQYVSKMLESMRQLLSTVEHRCTGMEQLLQVQLKVNEYTKQTANDALMNIFRLYCEPSHKIKEERAQAQNNNRLDRFLKRLTDHFTPPTSTSGRGRVGENSKTGATGKSGVIDVDAIEPGLKRGDRKRTHKEVFDPTPTGRPKKKGKTAKGRGTVKGKGKGRGKSGRGRTTRPIVVDSDSNSDSDSESEYDSDVEEQTATSIVAATTTVRVKKPSTTEFDPFEDPVPTAILESIRERYQEIAQEPEPVVQQTHRVTESIHQSFRQFVPQPPQMQCIDLTTPASGEPSAVSGNQPQQRRQVPVGDNDHRPLLRLSHIPRYHFAEAFFSKDIAQWARNMAWLWGTYGGMRDLGMVGDCRGGQANAQEVFQLVCDQNRSGLSMTYFKARLSEARHRGYTILQGLAD